jgi:hypothetical protein
MKEMFERGALSGASRKRTAAANERIARGRFRRKLKQTRNQR